MNVQEINTIWGKDLIKSLTIAQAAVVCCIGVTKDGKLRVAMTTDVRPGEVIEQLEMIVSQMKAGHKIN